MHVSVYFVHVCECKMSVCQCVFEYDTICRYKSNSMYHAAINVFLYVKA